MARSERDPETGELRVDEAIDARDLLRQIADAAWRCADPGVQYDTTINDWHTSPDSGRINASNPCSEYMHVDDSACNLASLNLMKFRRDDGTLRHRDVRARGRRRPARAGDRRLAVELPDRGDRRERARVPPARPGLRQPRRAADVERPAPTTRTSGRAVAAAITALMTGRAYRKSAEIAAAMGPYDELRGEPRAAQPRDAQAPRRRRTRSTALARRRGADRTPRSARGTRRRARRASTATATRRPRCSRRPGRSRS